MPARYILKQEAKDAMRGRKPSIYLVFFVYAVILYVLDILIGKISGAWMNADYLLDIIDDPDSLYYFANNAQPSILANIVVIAIEIMIIMLGIGFTIYALRISRYIEAGFGDLFDAFGMFFKFLWLSFLKWFFTFLWGLLLVVPGIIANYRYRMAIYIMLDNPELSARECIRRSKAMMRGHKLELWVLDLSFILWHLLSIIPFVNIYVSPYVEVTNAVYYNHLSGNFINPDDGNDGNYDRRGFENERESRWDNTKDPWEN